MFASADLEEVRLVNSPGLDVEPAQARDPIRILSERMVTVATSGNPHDRAESRRGRQAFGECLRHNAVAPFHQKCQEARPRGIRTVDARRLVVEVVGDCPLLHQRWLSLIHISEPTRRTPISY